MSAPKIIATGRCVPQRILHNHALPQELDTSDEWIYSRTGIHQRHICTGESGLDLAEAAARQAMERAAISPEDVGVCITATFSPDYASPSTACLLQKRLGLRERTICFDLNAACAGFLYALATANSLLELADKPYALVIGCEVISRVLDWSDRSSCVLFGDGAGAALLRREESAQWHTVFGTRSDAQSIWVEGPGPDPSHVHMEGKPVFRFAVSVVEQTIRDLLDQAKLTLEDIDLVVCHQANGKIIDHVAKKLGARPGQFYKNIEFYGNTSAASIPIALDELADVLKPGMRVLLVGFGAGLTWAGTLLTW